MNYTELSDTLEDICEDDFTATQIAGFVKRAEQVVYAAAQLPSLRKTASSAMVSGTAYMDAPTDFLSVCSFAGVVAATGAYFFMIDKDVSFIREAYPIPATTGQPKYYSLYGLATDLTELKFLFGPTPNANFATELQYNHMPESIVTAGDTWLGENFDNALLNAALLEALRHQRGDPEMIKNCKEMLKDSIDLLKNITDGKQRTDYHRTVQHRVKPQ